MEKKPLKMRIQTRNIGNVSFLPKNPSTSDTIDRRKTCVDLQEPSKFDSSLSLDFTRGKDLPNQICSTGCGVNGVRRALRPMEHRVLQHQTPTIDPISPSSSFYFLRCAMNFNSSSKGQELFVFKRVSLCPSWK